MAMRRSKSSSSQDIEGYSVQIIDFVMVPKKSSKLRVRKDLCDIISKVGDRPIHLISIAGASRQGKSFFLSILLNMLDSMHRGISDPWKELLNKDRLEGFDFEHGIDRKTVGFWMWSQPFILKRSDGTEIAVLVMDTQGVFDSTSTKRDWSMIVGLSLLTSSTLIYNVSQNILEDTLEVFHSFVEFGMLSLEDDPELRSPFHKLVFLIRDWNMPQVFPYGAFGGRRFIDRTLKITEGMPDELQRIRTKLKACFEEVDCCLMPYPGEPTKLVNYKGNLNKLDAEFLRHMKAFAEDLLELPNLRPKQTHGKNVTGKELLLYFEDYATAFNGINLPKPQALFEIIVDAKLKSIAETLLKSLNSSLQDQTEENIIYTVQEVDKIFGPLHRLAMQHFESQTAEITLEKNKKRHRENLSKEIIGIYQKTIARYSSEWEKLQHQIVEASGNVFKTIVDENISKMAHLPQQYEELTERAKSEAVKEVQRLCGNRDASFFQRLIPPLNDQLALIESKLKLENEKSLIKDRIIIDQAVLTLTQDYNDLLTVACGTGILSTSKLESVHQESEEKVFQKFRRQIKSSNILLEQETKSKLQENILKIFQERAKYVANQQNNLNAEADGLIKEGIVRFKQSLEQFMLQEPTLFEIQNQHNRMKTETIGKLNILYTLHPDRANYYIKNALQIIDEYLVELEQVFTKNKQIQQEKLENAIVHAIDNFKDDFAFQMKAPNFEFKRDFLMLCSQLKSKTLNSHEYAEGKWDSLMHDQFSEAVSIQIDDIIKETERNQEMLSHQARLELTTNLNDFVNEIKKILHAQIEENIIRDTDSLEKKHMLIVESYYKEFNSRPSIRKLSESEVQLLLNSTNSDLSETLRHFKSALTTKLEQEKLHIVAAETHAIEQYIKEMDISCTENSANDEQKLKEIHVLFKQKAQIEFKRKSEKVLTGKEQKEAEKRLVSNIEDLFTARKENFNGVALENLQMECCKGFEQKALHYKATCTNIDDYKINLKKVLHNQMDYLEIHKPSTSLENVHTIRSALLAQLKDLFQKYIEEYKTNAIHIDKLINKELTSASTYYDQKMNEFLYENNSKIFAEPKELANWHCQTKKEVVQQKLTAIEELPPNQLDNFRKTLEQQLDQKSILILTENKKGFELLNDNLTALLQDVILSFQKQLETTSLEASEQALDDMTIYAHSSISNKAISKTVKQKWLESIKVQLTQIQVEWKNDIPIESVLDLALVTAKQNYHTKMENCTRSNTHLDTNELHKCHQTAVEQAMDQLTCKRSPYVTRKVEETLELAFRKYSDLNDIRLAATKDISIGIDLGTTYSCVAVYRNDDVEMIPDRNYQKNTTPSYVLYHNNQKVVGQAAKDEAPIYPDKAVFDAKRLIGRKYLDPITQKDIQTWPFRVISYDDRPKIKVGQESYFPEQVSAEVLKKLRKDAELHLNCSVKNAVITVPAYFSDSQKTATKDAGAVAGLNILGIITEPTSAALAYSLTYIDDNHRNALVYDLGGGTFDVSVLSIKRGDILVKAVGGDNHLGGEDFDTNMLNYCLDQFQSTNGIDLRLTRLVAPILRRIRNICEQKKIVLSVKNSVSIIAESVHENIGMNVEITQDKFCELNDILFTKTIEIVQQALSDALLSASDIDDVLLVGGSTRIPKIQELLKNLFPGKFLNMTINPDEVVAKGAAIYAAIQSGSKARALQNLKFSDVAPLSLGIEVEGGKFSTIIPKNSKVPLSKTESYCTSCDGQTVVRVFVYEGEDRIAKKNNLLGKFYLRGIPPGPAGKESIDITISCNKEGILDVNAVICSTGGKNSIKIDAKRTNLSETELATLTDKTNAAPVPPYTWKSWFRRGK